jgi:hypothetical protein
MFQLSKNNRGSIPVVPNLFLPSTLDLFQQTRVLWPEIFEPENVRFGDACTNKNLTGYVM